ncbi:MAG: helix-turn-helix domain-containing protein [Meiothermus sp.]|nr:helix-turn-helix domain-containing protein [Meiothermus sp.]
MSPQIRHTLVAALGLAYLGTLVMSAGHLAAWFDLTRGGLPVWFSLGLAVGLELLAFTLSLASTLEPRLRWSFWGGLFFLGLVWAGNLLAMNRVADLALWEVLLQSMFALGPLVAGKAIGELLRWSGSPAQPAADRPAPVQAEQPGAPTVQPVPNSVPTQTINVTTVVQQSAPAQSAPELEPRAEQLLAQLSDRPVGLSELARLTAIPKTTVVRMLGNLIELGLVGRDGVAYVRVRGRADD